MTKRTVNIGLATYLRPDKLLQFGLYGETVDVDPKDLERFDRLNGEAPAEEPAEAEDQPEA